MHDNGADFWVGGNEGGKRAASENDDGRDGWIAAALGEHFTADEARCAGDYELHFLGYSRRGTEEGLEAGAQHLGNHWPTMSDARIRLRLSNGVYVIS
jgi:hypothetical protein